MSTIAKHNWLLKNAFEVLESHVEQVYFPMYSQVKKYEGLLGPDTMHSIHKLLGFQGGYLKFNHMNTCRFSGAVDWSEKCYVDLLQQLRIGEKGAKEAAWLAHFVTDATEPTHVIDWKVGSNKVKKLKRHLLLETKTQDITSANTLQIDKVSVPVREYLIQKRREIRDLSISLNSKIENVQHLYETKVVPIQIQSVVSLWLKAINQANAKRTSVTPVVKNKLCSKVRMTLCSQMIT